MVFLFETAKDGIVSVEANIVDGQLSVVPQSEISSKREAKDIREVARTLLAIDGKYEAGRLNLSDYK